MLVEGGEKIDNRANFVHFHGPSPTKKFTSSIYVNRIVRWWQKLSDRMVTEVVRHCEAASTIPCIG